MSTLQRLRLVNSTAKDIASDAVDIAGYRFSFRLSVPFAGRVGRWSHRFPEPIGLAGPTPIDHR